MKRFILWIYRKIQHYNYVRDSDYVSVRPEWKEYHAKR